MIHFILNNESISTDFAPGKTLLDFIRYQKRLTGTKIGCREGDCGACTVLFGSLVNNQVVYETATSCLTPMANISNKHVVTVEGLNMGLLSPAQQCMVDSSGTQCGFCTPGFIVSLSSLCLNNTAVDSKESISAIDGNICRCTGYKSIERAADNFALLLAEKPKEDVVRWAVKNGFVPDYFNTIAKRLEALPMDSSEANGKIVGGGTDLYVQQHDALFEAEIDSISIKEKRSIEVRNGQCYIPGNATVTDLMQSAIMQAQFPDLWEHMKLVSSTPIRNIATVAGNFVNASPIGDLTAFFMALDATLTLSSQDGNSREIKLDQFYNGYKNIELKKGEKIGDIHFSTLDNLSKFNFEKISKRTYLDIASVNTAILLNIDNDIIQKARISAGGVGPTPLYLKNTSEFLAGKKLSIELYFELRDVVLNEIAPISDVRGSKEYKSFALLQLIFAHFQKFAPTVFNEATVL